MKTENKATYSSPRITWEYADCSMPITFDQYSNCGHNCAYCFSQYQRGIGNSKEDYLKNKVKWVNVDRIKKIFRGEIKTTYYDWIKAKRPIQWGGLSDPFCPLEEKYGIGLELMKFFNEIEYPISFSSKGDLPIRDERYLNEFKKAGDRWHFKGSIITLDEKASELIEAGCPTPKRRIEVLERLHKECGTLTTWRMRPWIVGLTEKTMPEMVRKAKEIGCQSITTEFYCLELRASGIQKTIENYKKLSQATNQSIISFYKKNGTGCGYLRLEYDFLKPLIKKYIDECNKVGIKYFISDAKHKDKGCGGSCCGLLPENKHFNYAKMQMSHLIFKIKEKGSMTYDEALAEADENEMLWRTKTKLEGNRNIMGTARSKMRDMSFDDHFKKEWNSGFFERYFEGVIQVKGKDKKGNAIYFFNYKKAQI